MTGYGKALFEALEQKFDTVFPVLVPGKAPQRWVCRILRHRWETIENPQGPEYATCKRCGGALKLMNYFDLEAEQRRKFNEISGPGD